MKRPARALLKIGMPCVLVTQLACVKHECFCGISIEAIPFVAGKPIAVNEPVFAGRSYRLNIKSKLDVDLWAFRAPDRPENRPEYTWRDLEPFHNLPLRLKPGQSGWFPGNGEEERLVTLGEGAEEIAFVGLVPGYSNQSFNEEDAKFEACRMLHFARLCSTKDPPPVKSPDTKYPQRQDIVHDWVLINRRHSLQNR